MVYKPEDDPEYAAIMKAALAGEEYVAPPDGPEDGRPVVMVSLPLDALHGTAIRYRHTVKLSTLAAYLVALYGMIQLTYSDTPLVMRIVLAGLYLGLAAYMLTRWALQSRKDSKYFLRVIEAAQDAADRRLRNDDD